MLLLLLFNFLLINFNLTFKTTYSAIAMEDVTRYVIKNVTLKQSGHYECQANNNVPPVSSVHYFIEVLGRYKCINV